MGMSKRYKGKDCAYRGKPKSSSTNDHVVPRSFFLDSELGVELHIPQVPACAHCNNDKSKFENYAGAHCSSEANIQRQTAIAEKKLDLGLIGI